MLTLLIIVCKISALDGLSVYPRANTEQDKTTIHNCGQFKITRPQYVAAGFSVMDVCENYLHNVELHQTLLTNN